MMRTAVAAMLLATLVACKGPIGGAGISPSFGRATASNAAAQQADADAALRRLSRAFRAETDEVIDFASASAALDDPARRALRGQARWLAAHRRARVKIVGHTDLVGPEGYNAGLGLRRARQARAYLIRHGVSPGRVAAAESHGERDPLVPTPARERRNRRAITRLAGLAPGSAGPGSDGVHAQRIYDAYQAGETGVTPAKAGERAAQAAMPN